MARAGHWAFALPPPPGVDGVSLAPAAAEARAGKGFALSQYPRCGAEPRHALLRFSVARVRHALRWRKRAA